MAIEKTDAVLLRKRDLRETSLILTFFTKDFGKINGILKGVRGSRARSNMNPLFFSLNQIVFYESKKSDLFIVSQCEIQQVFLNILKEWDVASAAYYILELVDIFTEIGEKEEGIFENLLYSFESLNAGKNAFSIARLFEIKFLLSLGLWPGSGNFKLTKGATSTLERFENDNWKRASNIKLTRDVGEEIRKVTGKIIGDNLDRPLRTVRVFRI